MNRAFHRGEIAVQKRAGVDKMAARIGRSIRAEIHPVAANFLRSQPFVIAASTDAQGRVWASLITGEPGFIEISENQTVRLPLENIGSEILADNLKTSDRIGLLGIEFETRLRMRLNGRTEISGRHLAIHAEEVFSNCQKYIQARTWRRKRPKRVRPDATAMVEKKLSQPQQQLITEADTFFIASRHRTRGADASHRGGNPGFVNVLGDDRLIFPDYQGNMMFQTLGNLHEDPRCGLLFIDFDKGHLLQLSGAAEIIWDKHIYTRFAGAERAIRVQIEKVIETRHEVPFNWEFLNYSPANPV